MRICQQIVFVKNPLLYTTFAGYVGTLNTLGIMSNYNHSLFTATLQLTNGTAESALNDDGNFETVYSPTLFVIIRFFIFLFDR